MNKRQKRFCDEYLIDLNATQAAIRANYSIKTAEKASDWINEKSQEKPSSKFNKEMKNYIDERIKQIDDELIAKENEVLKHLTSVLRGKSESEVIVIEGTGDGCSEARKITKKPDEKEKLKAAELLGKRYGLYTDKIDKNEDLNISITIDYGDDEDDTN